MCLIAFAIGASPRWPLVIAANRDEFFNRPALPLARWQTAAGHSIISGRDLQAGGSWLGLSATGRIAMLTNVRELPQDSPAPARSRGELVMRWLDGDLADAQVFTAQTDPQAYGGFNLVIGDLTTQRWSCLSNRTFTAADSGVVTARPRHAGWNVQILTSGIYGLSNAALDTPWPKTQAVKTALTAALQASDAADLQAQLWTALANRQKAPLADLPDTGLPIALETALSSALISEAGGTGRGPGGYGTRCSTVLIARPLATDTDSRGRWTVSMEEITHSPPGSPESGLAGLRSAISLAI